ncbi:metal ABC transporter substrate-binding protein [Tropheryma whipplei]|uniref:metal ABC transporter substrate-binding protein n=1 Tax=Tropheryma whipplei TaxID=2039 RepID=UPI000B328B54|nr:metal ABC transporter substrate-binding protein [Tropheryma whipplei]
MSVGGLIVQFLSNRSAGLCESITGGVLSNEGASSSGSLVRRSVLRRLVFWAAAFVSVSLFTTACLAKSEDKTVKPVVYTSFGVLESITKSIAGDKLTVRSIVPQGGSVHEYEPKPSDVKDLANAKMLIVNGLHLEDEWLDKVLVDFKGVKVTASKGIAPILIAEDRSSGTPNPHAWVSPKDGAIYAKNITEFLSELDPKNKAYYQEHGGALEKRLQSLSEEFEKSIAKIPAAYRALVTCEGAFSYVAQAGGLEERYLWPVNSKNAETSKKVGELVDFVKGRKLPYVFCEYGVNTKFIEQVIHDSGGIAKLGGLFYVDGLVDKDGHAITYEQAIEQNIKVISETLGSSR